MAVSLRKLRVLIVEDRFEDAELMVYELGRIGTPVEWERVENEEDYLARLETSPDIILGDYNLPTFGALRALHLLSLRNYDIPFIVVTGSISDEVAAECIKKGAADYLLKDRLVRLGPAILQALNEKRLRDEKRDAENALRASEERYRQAFENNQAMKLLIDPLTGAIVEANSSACDFYGYSLEELTTKTIADISTLETDQSSVLTAKPIYFVFQQHLASGEIRDVEVYSSTIEVQEVPLLFWIVHDITERKRMETALLEAELLQVELDKEREFLTLKERFLSTVSHEFRTPLSIMMTSTQLLLRYSERLSSEQRLEYAQQIEDQVHYMNELLSDVLVLSKARAGKLPFTPAPLNVEVFCRSLFEQLQLTDNDQHRFVFHCEGEFEGAVMDGKLLRHSFVNLLSNAIKYTPTGKSVRFEMIGDGKTGIFRIIDEGIGIPLEDQKRLFEPFHRAVNTGSIEGTGLGLSIVQSNVEAHGGTITCTSQEGMGTTFEVRLPLV